MDWDEKPILNQTWIQLKVDFRSAVKKLKKAQYLQTNAMHANLVQDIVSGVQEALQPTIDADYSSPPSVTPTDQTDDTSLTPTIQMNAVTDSTVITMQQQIQQLQQMISQMQPNQHNGQFQQQQFQGYQRYNDGCGGRCEGRGGARGRGRGRGGRGRFNTQNAFVQQNQQPNPFFQNHQQNQQQNPFLQQQQQGFPRTYNRYCWSHGMCGHTSNICNRPLPGHCYEATIDNKMNGNTANCPT